MAKGRVVVLRRLETLVELLEGGDLSREALASADHLDEAVAKRSLFEGIVVNDLPVVDGHRGEGASAGGLA